MISQATNMEASQTPDWGGPWAPESEPDFKLFESALDDFSKDVCAKTWFRAAFVESSLPPTQWTRGQAEMIQGALSRAPAALMAAPYPTLRNLIKLRDLAAEQDKLPECFWRPLNEACDLLYMTQKAGQREHSGELS